MKVLIADDDPGHNFLLGDTLRAWGYEVVTALDGLAAWDALQGPDTPEIAVLDWGMPGLDGVEVCRRVRNLPEVPAVYLILLTGRVGRDNLVAGLAAGADDYLVKPVDPDELHARLRVGQRTVELQRNLAQQIQELREALAHVKQLQGLLPICAYCKKVRTDQNYWQQVEDYLAVHSDLRFSHGICPVCLERVMALLTTGGPGSESEPQV